MTDRVEELTEQEIRTLMAEAATEANELFANKVISNIAGRLVGRFRAEGKERLEKSDPVVLRKVAAFVSKVQPMLDDHMQDILWDGLKARSEALQEDEERYHAILSAFASKPRSWLLAMVDEVSKEMDYLTDPESAAHHA